MKNILKLVLVDAVLLFFSKLSALPVKLFTFIASKLGKLGFIFTTLAKLFTILGKILIIPFYILTAVLVLMLLLKLVKQFKKRKSTKLPTTSDIQMERNEKAVKRGIVKQMDIFSED